MSDCYEGLTNWGPDGPPSDADPEDIDFAESAAWNALYVLTGQQLRLCPVQVRPCARKARRGSYYVAPVSGSPFMPISLHGQWVNVVCGCETQCFCDSTSVIELPGARGVKSVQIGSLTIDSDTYRFEGGKLYRLDGAWPMVQDMSKPAGAEGTFVVEAWVGAGPSDLLRRAAGILAGEYLLALADDNSCRLPANVTAVTRQGVSYEMSVTMFDEGKTGIQEVDQVIALYNPNALRLPTIVASPDVRSRW